jgi:hypothetical protein
MQFFSRNLTQAENLHLFWKLCNDFWFNAIWHILGLATLWNACLKWHKERFAWQVAITAIPIFYFFCPSSIYIVKIMCNILKIYFQTGRSSSPSYSHNFFLIAVLEEDFIRNIIIIIIIIDCV